MAVYKSGMNKPPCACVTLILRSSVYCFVYSFSFVLVIPHSHHLYIHSFLVDSSHGHIHSLVPSSYTYIYINPDAGRPSVALHQTISDRFRTPSPSIYITSHRFVWTQGTQGLLHVNPDRYLSLDLKFDLWSHPLQSIKDPTANPKER